ncbi:MAG: D-glycerate dehydrogenase [Gemmatimonadaceae bacterium]
MNPRIVVTRRLPDTVEEQLSSRYRATLNRDDIRMSADQLRDALCSADILLCTLGDRLTRELLEVSGRRTRMLANFGAGVDHIDQAAARDLGLVVTNTPGVLTEDTADLAMMLILSTARRASEGELELRRGAWTGWRPTHLLGSSVHGATLGIIGLGRIGEALARRAHLGFGMKIRYLARANSTRAGRPPEYAIADDTLNSLLRASDFVSLHCPSTPETYHLIDAAALAEMRPTAFLINTARGEVVDASALAQALNAGTIAGAGLDVYEGEPAINPALLSAPNVTLLPHVGSATIGSRTAMGMMCLENIEAFIAGREPPNQIP